MVQLTVVRSLRDFLEGANIPFTVLYSVQSTEFGVCLIGSIHKYLCYLTFHETPPANKGHEIITNAFPDGKCIYDETLLYNADPTNFNSMKNIHILAEGTEFQEKVWRALLNIPRGKTVYYSELASMANVPASIRACASAVGKNPVSLLLPCHRVIGKNGNICKFGSGEVIKRRLWKAEGINL